MKQKNGATFAPFQGVLWIGAVVCARTCRARTRAIILHGVYTTTRLHCDRCCALQPRVTRLAKRTITGIR